MKEHPINIVGVKKTTKKALALRFYGYALLGIATGPLGVILASMCLNARNDFMNLVAMLVYLAVPIGVIWFVYKANKTISNIFTTSQSE